jgi:hypothetical protein
MSQTSTQARRRTSRSLDDTWHLPHWRRTTLPSFSLRRSGCASRDPIFLTIFAFEAIVIGSLIVTLLYL